MDFITEANVLAVLTAILVGVAKTGVSGMAILVVPLIAMVFPAKELSITGSMLSGANWSNWYRALRSGCWWVDCS
jgi:hypothetical protein